MSKLDSLTLDGLSHFIVLGKRSGFRRVPQHLLITDRYELANALRPFTDVRASDLPRLRLFYRRISQSQKLPETGEFAGHLALALLAAGYCAAKVQKDVGGELPIEAVRDIKPLEAAGVLTASPEDKYARVLEMVPQYLPGEMKGAFANLVTPEAIGTTVAILVLWAGSHALGVGFAIDVLLLAIGFAMAGWSIFAAVGDVIEFFEIMNTARSDADLNRAAKKLAGAIAALGVGTFIALLTRGAGRIAAAKKASVARKPKGGGGDAVGSRTVPQSAMPKTGDGPRRSTRKKTKTENDDLQPTPKSSAANADDLASIRSRHNLSDRNTVAASRTDIAGLEDQLFEGLSPALRREAGLESLDDLYGIDRPIRSPNPNPIASRHAEEDVLNALAKQIDDLGLTEAQLNGRTVNVHISNPKGVCNVCYQGLGKSTASPGVIRQFSERYPGLNVHVTAEGGAVRPGINSVTVRGGQIVD